MSLTYLFFAPARLPLTTDTLDEAVRPFTDLANVRATLGAHLPNLAWHASPDGALASGTVAESDSLWGWRSRRASPTRRTIAVRRRWSSS